MRAIVLDRPGGPEGFRLEEIEPPSPGPGEVTIDVAFAGVGFVDTLFRKGVFPLPPPLIVGLEVAGTVREIGADVTDFQPGQPVAALLNNFVDLPGAGGYAEVTRARADLTVPLRNADEGPSAAAVLINGTTAWLAIHDVAALQPRETVLVLGAAGGLGAILGQLARAAGAGLVVGVVGSEAKRQAALALGYHEVVAAPDLPSWLKRDQGFALDVVFDPVGGTLRRLAFDNLSPFGRQVILGNASKTDETFHGDEFWHGTKSLRGLSLGRITHRIPLRVAHAARQVLDFAAAAQITAAPQRIMPLTEAAEAHRLLETRAVTGKIVLRI